MAQKARVLLIEDTATLARSYVQFLRHDPYDIQICETGTAGLEALKSANAEFDVVLLDLMLPDMGGLDVLGEMQNGSGAPLPPVVVITAHGSVQTAVEAMQAGATDFLMKPFNAARLRVTIANALKCGQLQKKVRVYEEEIAPGSFEGFVGGSLAMQRVYSTIRAAAPSKVTVFITGESGTGKELCAEAIRARSPRRDGPFIALNCAALPKDLVESEIFGHVRGAFSGAVSDRVGAAKQADGGTLFLDEICEMDFDLQAKLLRFLQTERFMPVGATRAEEVDVRLVCATNRNPLEEVHRGRFREDLYYRLYVVPIQLPGLRERPEDIADIAGTLLARFAKREGKSFNGFDDDAMAVMERYPWPGNVRELENVIQNIVVLNDEERITAAMLPPAVTGGSAGAGNAGGGNAGGALNNGKGASVAMSGVTMATDNIPPMPSLGETPGPGLGKERDMESLSRLVRPLDAIEREAIERAIDLCDGNVRTAAALLGVAPQTIYRKRAAWN